MPWVNLSLITFQLSNLKSSCLVYVSRMREIAADRRLTLASRKAAEVEARRDVLRAATKRHKEAVAKIRENRKSRIELEERKKQMVFEDLREQMLAEQKRRYGFVSFKREREREIPFKF